MIKKILDNWKYVLKFDTEHRTDKGIITDIMHTAWQTTPSKNSFMPYRVHVIGPEEEGLKKAVYETSAAKEKNSNSRNPNPDQWEVNGNKASLLTAEYILVFTPRAEDNPSPWQIHLHEGGCYMDAWYEDKLQKYRATILVEVGLFAQAVSTLCLEQGLHTNYISSFESDLKYWEDLDFIKHPPCLIMGIGKAKYFRRDWLKTVGWDEGDHKPSFDSVVHFYGVEK